MAQSVENELQTLKELIRAGQEQQSQLIRAGQEQQSQQHTAVVSILSEISSILKKTQRTNLELQTQFFTQITHLITMITAQSIKIDNIAQTAETNNNRIVTKIDQILSQTQSPPPYKLQ